MASVEKSALVPFSAKQMFDLVNDTASYSEFVPYCVKAIVHHQNEFEQEATLHFAKGAIKSAFTTRNQLMHGRQIDVNLLKGPFKHLAGTWDFKPMGHDACRVQLNLDFEISNPLLKMTFGKLFNQIADRLVNTFVERASQVYG